MRHGKKTTSFKDNRMLRNMARSLILHKRITAPLARLKALRPPIEHIITKSKTGSMHHRRQVFSYFQDKNTVKEIFNDIAFKVGNRPGGYTRIIRLKPRPGDGAEMGLIELVDYNENFSNPRSASKMQKTEPNQPSTTTA